MEQSIDNQPIAVTVNVLLYDDDDMSEPTTSGAGSEPSTNTVTSEPTTNTSGQPTTNATGRNPNHERSTLSSINLPCSHLAGMHPSLQDAPAPPPGTTGIRGQQVRDQRAVEEEWFKEIKIISVRTITAEEKASRKNGAKRKKRENCRGESQPLQLNPIPEGHCGEPKIKRVMQGAPTPPDYQSLFADILDLNIGCLIFQPERFAREQLPVNVAYTINPFTRLELRMFYSRTKDILENFLDEAIMLEITSLQGMMTQMQERTLALRKDALVTLTKSLKMWWRNNPQPNAIKPKKLKDIVQIQVKNVFAPTLKELKAALEIPLTAEDMKEIQENNATEELYIKTGKLKTMLEHCQNALHALSFVANIEHFLEM